MNRPTLERESDRHIQKLQENIECKLNIPRERERGVIVAKRACENDRMCEETAPTSRMSINTIEIRESKIDV